VPLAHYDFGDFQDGRTCLHAALRSMKVMEHGATLIKRLRGRVAPIVSALVAAGADVDASMMLPPQDEQDPGLRLFEPRHATWIRSEDRDVSAAVGARCRRSV
jgi:hypothetical protein